MRQGILPEKKGAVAQLGERVNGIHEVEGSSPSGSTTHEGGQMARPELVKNISREKASRLAPENELVLKTTKEIVVKFIEMGRCSPASFEEVFKLVFKTIKDTVVQD